MSIKEVARRLGLARNTVRAALRADTVVIKACGWAASADGGALQGRPGRLPACALNSRNSAVTTAQMALRVTATVPLAPDETAGWLLLDPRPPIVAGTVELERAGSSPGRAHLFVRAACAEWQLDTIRDDATAAARHQPPVGGCCSGCGEYRRRA